MFSLNIKIYLYIALAVAVSGAFWYSINTWHYTPIKKLTNRTSSLEKQLYETGSLLNTCEMNLTKEKLQAVIDTIGDQNETIIIDFNNAWY